MFEDPQLENQTSTSHHAFLAELLLNFVRDFVDSFIHKDLTWFNLIY